MKLGGYTLCTKTTSKFLYRSLRCRGKSKTGAVVSVTGCDEETWDVESVSVITVGDTLSGEPSDEEDDDSGLISAAVSVVEDGSGEDSVG